MAPNIKEVDLYETLDIAPSATEAEIKKAYRKKALKCHPDKNPDDPKAPELWELICKALEILTDEKARALYDKVLKARKANELRNKALEAKRRKVKQDLEAREAGYRDETEVAQDAARKLEQEIRRLREEGSQILAREQKLMKEQIRTEKQEASEETAKLRLKWKSKKQDETNGGYSYDNLMQAFRKYGKVCDLLISSKKKGSAIVEFESSKAAVWAVQSEIGMPSNPLKISWLSGEPETAATNTANPYVPPGPDEDFEAAVLRRLQAAHQGQEEGSPASNTQEPDTKETLHPSAKIFTSNKPTDNLPSFIPESDQTSSADADTAVKRNASKMTDAAKDFESLTMMRMRQAEERKKVIEQMMKEDEES